MEKTTIIGVSAYMNVWLLALEVLVVCGISYQKMLFMRRFSWFYEFQEYFSLYKSLPVCSLVVINAEIRYDSNVWKFNFPNCHRLIPNDNASFMSISYGSWEIKTVAKLLDHLTAIKKPRFRKRFCSIYLLKGFSI